VTGVVITEEKNVLKKGQRVLPRAAYKKDWPRAKPADRDQKGSQLSLQKECSSRGKRVWLRY